MPPIELTYVGKQHERPPVIRADFDTVLHNTRDTARWFVLPTHAKGTEQTYQVSGLAGYRLQGDDGNQVIASRLRGTKGCYVIYVASGVQITLRQLPIRWRSALTDNASLTAHVAKDIRLGKESITDWLDTSPLNTDDADVSGQPLGDDLKVVYAKRTSDLSQVTVELVDAESFTIDLAFA